jgi:hypothetical protein
MAEAIAGNAAGDDASPLGQEIPQKADVLEIDGALFNAKPARPAPLKKSPAAAAIRSPAATAATFAFHNPLVLLRFFVFVMRILLHGSIAAASVAAAFTPLRQKRDRLRHDFVLAALLSVFGLPSSLLQPTIHDDAVSLAEILAAMLGLFAEHHNVHETHFLFQLISLFVSPAHRQS